LTDEAKPPGQSKEKKRSEIKMRELRVSEAHHNLHEQNDTKWHRKGKKVARTK
jgi:hypothetical protein